MAIFLFFECDFVVVRDKNKPVDDAILLGTTSF